MNKKRTGKTMIDTPEQIKQFLTLSQKNHAALTEICKHLDLDTTGSKTDLILRLIDKKEKSAEVVAISSKASPEASPLLRKVRNLINEAKQSKIFNLQTAAGRPLDLELEYILCPEDIRSKILDWCLSINDSQKNLINLAKGDSNNITVYLVNKKAGKDSWIMALLQKTSE